MKRATLRTRDALTRQVGDTRLLALLGVNPRSIPALGITLTALATPNP